MFKKLLLALVGVVLVVGAIVYVKLGQFGAMADAGARMAPPPETVTAMTAEPARWEQTLTATGTLTAVQGVTVAAETSGRVKRIEFESGARVEAGDLLVQFDTASETAQLASAEAAADLARATITRRRELGSRQLVSAADIDTAAAQAKEAAAQVGVVRAMMARKAIRAPFGGRLGIRQVNLGQIMREGDPIATLQSLDPIQVDFALPQQQLPLIEVQMPVRLTTDAAPGEVFEGRINAISPEVDAATRNLRVQARIKNDRELLRAGMFVHVDVVLPKQREVLAIAATAVLYAPYGDSVFVIEAAAPEKPENGDVGAKGAGNGDVPKRGDVPKGGAADGKVLRQRFVRLGTARGDFVDVLEGLKAGDRVVTSGVFKLRSGMAVVVDNTLAPKPSLEPKLERR